MHQIAATGMSYSANTLHSLIPDRVSSGKKNACCSEKKVQHTNRRSRSLTSHGRGSVRTRLPAHAAHVPYRICSNIEKRYSGIYKVHMHIDRGCSGPEPRSASAAQCRRHHLISASYHAVHGPLATDTCYSPNPLGSSQLCSEHCLGRQRRLISVHREVAHLHGRCTAHAHA